MVLAHGTHKLPVNADTRNPMGKNEGDTVTIILTERIERD